MPPPRPTDLLAPLVARFEKRRPVRAGSLIVTLYGDAIAPRGGSLWLGSLNGLLAPFGIEPGLVRTAMSRLVGEGWFERNRVGKSSYYRLSERGAAEFTAAGERIYRVHEVAWTGKLEIVTLTAAEVRVRQADRDRMTRLGFGQLAPYVMIRPVTDMAVTIAGEGCAKSRIGFSATSDASNEALRSLVESAWRLDEIAAAYRAFLGDIVSIAGSPKSVERLADADAMRLRILLVHEWRRIVLRDPLLPQTLLPADWPGAAAREACAAVYRAARPGCERWLDREAVNERGALPKAAKASMTRFE